MAKRGEIGFFGEVCTWQGASGRRYRFSVYSLESPLMLALDGVYVFAKPGDLFTPYRPLLIDHCADFARELPGSPAWYAALAAGATALHLYYCNLTNPDRRPMARDLIERCRPPLNADTGWRRPADPPAPPAEPRGVVIPFPLRRQSA